MGTDNSGTDIDNEARGDGSSTADTDNRADDIPDDQQQQQQQQQHQQQRQQQQPRLVATTTSENFTVPASAVEPAPATLKCRAFPHGVYSVVISFWTGFAWLICFSQDGCDYARVYGPSIADITNDPSTPFIDTGFSRYRAPVLENGEWILDMTTPCVEYNTDIVTIGAAVQFAKVASFLASVLGGAGAIFIWFSLCLFIDKIRWRGVAFELLAACVLQALSFTSFASSLCQTNNCSMSYGARANLLACVMWAVSALTLFCYVPPARGASSGTQQMHDRNNETGIPTAPSTSASGVPELI